MSMRASKPVGRLYEVRAMTTPRKETGRAVATRKTFSSRNSSPTASRIKALIVGAACWGVIPFGLAGWLIRALHLEAA